MSDNAHTLFVLPEANSRVVSGFLDYLKVEKGLASLTVAAYTSDVAQFTGFLDKRKRSLLSARRNDVRDFIQQLFANSVDGRSVGRKLSALRHLYRYLLLDKLIQHDPTLNIDSPKQWKVLPKSLARDEMEIMLRADRPASKGKYGGALALRDRAMLEVFYAGALRVSEIVSVKLEDLKLDLGYVLVRGKGDKERIVPLGKSAQDVAGHIHEAGTSATGGRGHLGAAISRTGSAQAYSSARMADGSRRVIRHGTQRQPAHVAPQLRHSHGRKWRRLAHGADDPWPL